MRIFLPDTPDPKDLERLQVLPPGPLRPHHRGWPLPLPARLAGDGLLIDPVPHWPFHEDVHSIETALLWFLAEYYQRPRDEGVLLRVAWRVYAMLTPQRLHIILLGLESRGYVRCMGQASAEDSPLWSHVGCRACFKGRESASPWEHVGQRDWCRDCSDTEES